MLPIIASDPLVKIDRSPFGTILNPDSYSHTIKSIGGYWSADINQKIGIYEVNDWLQNGLGKHIETYNPSLVLIWEGFVNQITMTLGPLQLVVGPLIGGEMGNQVETAYATIDTSVDPPVLGIRVTTASASDTDSQDRYGIIEKVVSLSGATDTEAEQARDNYLIDKAFPEVSRQSTLGGNEPSVRLSCMGYYQWLKAFIYNNAGTGYDNLSDKIQDILGTDPNSIFSTDYSRITENTTQVRAQEDNDKTGETILSGMIGLGDASNNTYNAGFYANRQFIYETIPTSIRYEQQLTGNRGITENGRIVEPWNVQAGEWLFYTDILIGNHPPNSSADLRSDLRTVYIDTVKYDTPYGLSINGKEISPYDILSKRLGSGTV